MRKIARTCGSASTMRHALVKVRLVSADVVVRHPAHDFVDFGHGALDRLKDLERMLVKDVERALDPVIGDGIFMAVVQPGSEGEQHERQPHRRNHHQLQQSDGGLRSGTHCPSFHNSMTTTMNMCPIPSDRQEPRKGSPPSGLPIGFWPKFVRNWSAACAMSSCGERTTHVQPTAMNARLHARPRGAAIWRAVGWALLILLAIAGRAAAQTAVDLQLVLAVDASGSVGLVRFELQKRGDVDAFRHARVLQAIRSGPSRAIAVTMVQWTGPMLQVQVVGWTLVGNEETAAAFAAAIERAPRQLFGGGTSISGAIDYATTLFPNSPFRPSRRVIDISGDGSNNRGRPVMLAR